MKLDILVLSSHPDDAELGCAGTIASHVSQGYKIGIVDLTRGELGTRGSIALRQQEADASARILGLTARENLGLRDGYFTDGEEECHAVIRAIRKYRPEIILANAPDDRHPDHAMGGKLAYKAGFLSGLAKIETQNEGQNQEPWRARHIFHYIQDKFLTPDFVIDITDQWEIKIKSVLAYSSQFYNETSQEPVTYISTPDFLNFLEARSRELGHSIGVSHGEGFIKKRQLGLKNMLNIY